MVSLGFFFVPRFIQLYVCITYKSDVVYVVFGAHMRDCSGLC